jgi:hypothetical protein
MSVEIDRMLLAIDRHNSQLMQEIHDLRRRIYAWQMVAHDLNAALSIQCTVYTPDGFMSITGRDAVSKFEELQAKELPTP